jgi:hypothetical protein
MPRSPARLAGLALALAVLGGAARATRADDGAADSAAFEQKLGTLLDRFCDDAGADRLGAALALCQKRLEAKPDDWTAQVEVARLEAARERFPAAEEAARKAEKDAAQDKQRLAPARALVFLAFFSAADERVDQGKMQRVRVVHLSMV